MLSNRWLLLATVSAALLLIGLDNSILYTALPSLTTELGASDTEILWIINAYPLVMSGLLLGAGTLGDRVGHRRMFEIGLVIFGLGSLAAAFSPTPAPLIAARALLAVGAASMMPATLALIRIRFTDIRERNVAIAVWGTMSIVGLALGPLISGALLSVFWWGSVFLINLPVVVLALIAIPLVAPANDASRSTPWDLTSSLMAMVTLTGLVLLIKEAFSATPSLVVMLSAAVAVVIGGVMFTRRQRRLEHPLLDFTIFKNPAFSSGVAAAALATFAIAGFQLITTQRFQIVADFTPLQAGTLMACLALGAFPISLLAGAFLHITGLQVVISGGLLLAGLGAAIAALTDPDHLPLVVVGLVLLGAGLGAVMAVASTAIVGNAPRHRAGMASSVEEVSYEFGNLIGVALLGTLLTTFYKLSFTPPAGTSDEAAQSLAQALIHGVDTPAVLEAAFTAFDAGYRMIALIICAALVIGALVIAGSLRYYGWRTESTPAEVMH